MRAGGVKYYIKAYVPWAWRYLVTYLELLTAGHWQQIEICCSCEKYYSRQGCLGLYMVLLIDVPSQRRRRRRILLLRRHVFALSASIEL